MSLPRYRLQPVLDSKEKRKKEAEKNLGEVRKELARQEQILQEKEAAVVQATQKKDQYTADFQTKLSTGMETGKITAAKAYIEVLKKNIELAKKKVEEQKKVIEEWKKKEHEALLRVTETTKEMKVIEKHKENWAESVKKEIEFKEDQEQEEVAQNLYEQFRRQKQS
jgi:hypothetical protein